MSVSIFMLLLGGSTLFSMVFSLVIYDTMTKAKFSAFTSTVMALIAPAFHIAMILTILLRHK